tara:strand:- start:10295 stop:10486 length:192 start_codon:yes stop_codon:yes gene_type:complete
MKQNVTEKYYSIKELTELLGISYRSIRNIISSGELPHYRLGERKIRVRKTDFDAWIGQKKASV